MAIFFATLLGPAFGQTSTSNPDVVRAFQNFATSPTLKLTLDGSETANNRTKTARVELSFLMASSSSGTTVALVEVLETQDEAIVQRCVGDGANLWIYNARLNEYMAIPYGSLDGSRPGDYFARLTDGLGAHVGGFGVYPVRFLRDVLYRRDSMGSLGATFRSWTPGFAPVQWLDGSGAHPDPIVPNRAFRPDALRFFVHYANGATPTKAVTFEFEQGSSSSELTYAYGSELSPIARTNRIVEWQIGFARTGLTFAPETFRFVPPLKSKAVPAPRIGN